MQLPRQLQSSHDPLSVEHTFEFLSILPMLGVKITIENTYLICMINHIWSTFSDNNKCSQADIADQFC